MFDIKFRRKRVKVRNIGLVASDVNFHVSVQQIPHATCAWFSSSAVL
jgi:hypothetical protein